MESQYVLLINTKRRPYGRTRTNLELEESLLTILAEAFHSLVLLKFAIKDPDLPQPSNSHRCSKLTIGTAHQQLKLSNRI
jgi:hypothetical protein